jgi:hypothetical protein
MELLAPVIVDFPVKTDITGQLETDDYPAALQTVRKWFVNNNMEYNMRNEIY